MNEKSRFPGWVVVLIGLAIMLLSACATMNEGEAEADKNACVAPGKLMKQIAPEAQLEAFTCSFESWEGADTLHFHVTLKNITSQPQRFRVNIFMDNGKAVGGLMPSSTKSGLVEPGQSASFVYPVPAMPVKPNEVTLMVTTGGM